MATRIRTIMIRLYRKTKASFGVWSFDKNCFFNFDCFFLEIFNLFSLSDLIKRNFLPLVVSAFCGIKIWLNFFVLFLRLIPAEPFVEEFVEKSETYFEEFVEITTIC